MNSPVGLPARGTWPEVSRLINVLRLETVGGLLLVIAAALGLVAANATSWFENVRDTTLGYANWGLDLTVGMWVSDGLLAVFFFLVGLELKREFVVGDLRDPRRAIIPMAAAVGGMIVPALIFTALNFSGAIHGWAIPTATDIAFAVAVLALLGSHLPTGLRTFLLTLAIVDDLLAIIVIAIFYTETLHLQWLLLAAVFIGLFWFMVRRTKPFWPLLFVLALGAWGCVHASGIHATIAGVVLGFMIPVIGARATTGDRIEDVVHPISAGFIVPLFAFFAAGISLDPSQLAHDLTKSPIAIGVAAGLVAGKTIGIFGTTWLVAHTRGANLDEELSWWDILGLSMLAGIGFTVALLISDLAFRGDPALTNEAKVGIIVGTLIATLLATIVLRLRERVYKRIAIEEARDDNADGIPDIYQTESTT